MTQQLSAGFILILALVSTQLGAHGGLSMDEDECVLALGVYRMHFTGYQPKKTMTVEFCEDIPTTGETIIVLDFIGKELKSLPIEFRIINAESFSETGNIDGSTLLLLPAQLYRSGVIVTEHRFVEDGDFIGLVTAYGEQIHRSEFPFSVGKVEEFPDYIYLLLAIMIAAVILYVAYGRKFIANQYKRFSK